MTASRRRDGAADDQAPFGGSQARLRAACEPDVARCIPPTMLGVALAAQSFPGAVVASIAWAMKTQEVQGFAFDRYLAQKTATRISRTDS